MKHSSVLEYVKHHLSRCCDESEEAGVWLAEIRGKLVESERQSFQWLSLTSEFDRLEVRLGYLHDILHMFDKGLTS